MPVEQQKSSLLGDLFTRGVPLALAAAADIRGAPNITGVVQGIQQSREEQAARQLEMERVQSTIKRNELAGLLGIQEANVRATREQRLQRESDRRFKFKQSKQEALTKLADRVIPSDGTPINDLRRAMIINGKTGPVLTSLNRLNENTFSDRVDKDLESAPAQLRIAAGEDEDEIRSSLTIDRVINEMDISDGARTLIRLDQDDDFESPFESSQVRYIKKFIKQNPEAVKDAIDSGDITVVADWMAKSLEDLESDDVLRIFFEESKKIKRKVPFSPSALESIDVVTR